MQRSFRPFLAASAVLLAACGSSSDEPAPAPEGTYSAVIDGRAMSGSGSGLCDVGSSYLQLRLSFGEAGKLTFNPPLGDARPGPREAGTMARSDGPLADYPLVDSAQVELLSIEPTPSGYRVGGRFAMRFKAMEGDATMTIADGRFESIDCVDRRKPTAAETR